MKLSKLAQRVQEAGLVIQFIAEQEFDDPRDSFSEKEDKDWVLDQINKGNAAAWFCAKCVVCDGVIQAVDYLGGCSYNSFDEFTSEDGGYFDDMIHVCLDRLNDICEQAQKTKVIINNLMSENK